MGFGCHPVRCRCLAARGKLDSGRENEPRMVVPIVMMLTCVKPTANSELRETSVGDMPWTLPRSSLLAYNRQEKKKNTSLAGVLSIPRCSLTHVVDQGCSTPAKLRGNRVAHVSSRPNQALWQGGQLTARGTRILGRVELEGWLRSSPMQDHPGVQPGNERTAATGD